MMLTHYLLDAILILSALAAIGTDVWVAVDTEGAIRIAVIVVLVLSSLAMSIAYLMTMKPRLDAAVKRNGGHAAISEEGGWTASTRLPAWMEHQSMQNPCCGDDGHSCFFLFARRFIVLTVGHLLPIFDYGLMLATPKLVEYATTKQSDPDDPENYVAVAEDTADHLAQKFRCNIKSSRMNAASRRFLSADAIFERVGGVISSINRYLSRRRFPQPNSLLAMFQWQCVLNTLLQIAVQLVCGFAVSDELSTAQLVSLYTSICSAALFAATVSKSITTISFLGKYLLVLFDLFSTVFILSTVLARTGGPQEHALFGSESVRVSSLLYAWFIFKAIISGAVVLSYWLLAVPTLIEWNDTGEIDGEELGLLLLFGFLLGSPLVVLLHDFVKVGGIVLENHDPEKATSAALLYDFVFEATNELRREPFDWRATFEKMRSFINKKQCAGCIAGPASDAFDDDDDDDDDKTGTDRSSPTPVAPAYDGGDALRQQQQQQEVEEAAAADRAARDDEPLRSVEDLAAWRDFSKRWTATRMKLVRPSVVSADRVLEPSAIRECFDFFAVRRPVPRAADGDAVDVIVDAGGSGVEDPANIVPSSSAAAAESEEMQRQHTAAEPVESAAAAAAAAPAAAAPPAAAAAAAAATAAGGGAEPSKQLQQQQHRRQRLLELQQRRVREQLEREQPDATDDAASAVWRDTFHRRLQHVTIMLWWFRCIRGMSLQQWSYSGHVIDRTLDPADDRTQEHYSTLQIPWRFLFCCETFDGRPTGKFAFGAGMGIGLVATLLSSIFAIAYIVIFPCLYWSFLSTFQIVMWTITMVVSVILLALAVPIWNRFTITRVIDFVLGHASSVTGDSFQLLIDSYTSLPNMDRVADGRLATSQVVPSGAFDQHVLPFLSPSLVSMTGIETHAEYNRVCDDLFE